MTQPGSTPELFSPPPPTATWAEDADVQVPEALRFLEGRGVAFTIIPRYTWNNDGPVTVLKKQLSVTFQVDTVVTSNDIVFAFDEAGISVDDITSIQRKTSSKSWVVSFKTATIKEQALALPHITIAGCQVFLGDAENVTVLVKVYSYANAVKSKLQRKAESGESKKVESKKSEPKKGDSTKKSQHKPRETESDTTHVEPQSEDEERNHKKKRDRERECERERDRERPRRDRERERSREHSRERERDRDRESYHNRYYRDYDYYYDDRHPHHRSSRDHDDDEGWTLVTNRKRSGRSRS